MIAKTIELLAPAGSPEALDAAVGEGADAVYLGLKDFNARMRSANFTYSQFEGALRSLRRMGKKVYVTVNTVFEQREADRMYQFLKYLAAQGPDAIIVQDFGVVAMARSEFPSLRIHASTQMNIASARGANALSRHGVSRVVLARELSLEELRGIKTETNLELEVFVHGALCICVSGICLFSGYLGGKSANRGMCTQACRRLYHENKDQKSKQGQTSGGSGYFFSPNDLQLLECIPELAATRITAMKIEGRMKSASYVGAVVSAYRLVVDAVMQGDDDQISQSIGQGREILRNDFARPKTQYFFYGGQNAIDWLNPDQDGGTGISLGRILKIKGHAENRRALVSPPCGIVPSVRDSVRIHRSDDSGRISQKLSCAEPDKNGCYWISAPEGSSGDHVYLIQTKEMRKRYTPVINEKRSGSKGPGREKAPLPRITLCAGDGKENPGMKDYHTGESGGKVKNDSAFPEGLYVAVSRPEDFFIVQSSRPQGVMLSLSGKTANHLLADMQPLPFKPEEIILTLDPWFPHEIAGYGSGRTVEVIGRLTEKGYFRYMVNNPGHFSLFRGYEKVKLIAGPWLYIFNSWSLSFVASLGADYFVSPFENNRQNLERTLSAESRGEENKNFKRKQKRSVLHSKFFITVFAWPPLFSIRANLGQILKFNSFSDNRDESFSLAAGSDGSRVYPNEPFSIIDKIPFLKESGFSRFIIDLSGSALKKSNYKDLMRLINENIPIPNANRFNWKDGFYSDRDLRQ